MSLSDWIGVLSAVVGTAIGSWGIYLTLRRVKYPGKLLFIRRYSIALLNATATRFPNLKLLYKDAPIGKSVVLISGHVANVGAIDMKPEDVEQPLTCMLPGACVWLDFKVTSASQDLRVDPVQESSTVVRLDFGQFRREESFWFQALAQLDDDHAAKQGSAFTSLLKWRHRIAGFGEVKEEQFVPFNASKPGWRMVRSALFLVVAIVFATFSSCEYGLILSNRSVVAFEYTDAGKKALYSMAPDSDGNATLLPIDGGSEKKINLVEAVKVDALKPVQVPWRPTAKSFFLGTIFLIVGAGAFASAFFRDRRTRRIHKMLTYPKKGAS